MQLQVNGIDLPMKNITDPRDVDVLCGRGGAALRHPGNQTYRRLVNLNKGLYITCLKTEKLKISRSIVAAIREQKGRFLERDGNKGTWYDIGDKKAIEKTSQALREGQPKLRQKMVELGSGPTGGMSLEHQFGNGIYNPHGMPNPAMNPVMYADPAAFAAGMQQMQAPLAHPGMHRPQHMMGHPQQQMMAMNEMKPPAGHPMSQDAMSEMMMKQLNLNSAPNMSPQLGQSIKSQQLRQQQQQQQQQQQIHQRQQQMLSAPPNISPSMQESMKGQQLRQQQQQQQIQHQQQQMQSAPPNMSPSMRESMKGQQLRQQQQHQQQQQIQHQQQRMQMQSAPPNMSPSMRESMKGQQLRQQQQIHHQQQQMQSAPPKMSPSIGESMKGQQLRQQQQLQHRQPQMQSAAASTGMGIQPQQQPHQSNMGEVQQQHHISSFGQRSIPPVPPAQNSTVRLNLNKEAPSDAPSKQQPPANVQPPQQPPLSAAPPPPPPRRPPQPPSALAPAKLPPAPPPAPQDASQALKKLDRRRLFAKMKFSRQSSARFARSDGSLGADGMPDIHMVESTFSLMSNISGAGGKDGIAKSGDHKMKEVLANYSDHGRRDEYMTYGSRRSLMSGLSKISDSSDTNSMFSDLSRKIGNVSTRSIAMSEISGIEEGYQEDLDESFSIPPQFDS